MWLRPISSSAEAASSDRQPWIPAATPSGHFAPVSDLKVTVHALRLRLISHHVPVVSRWFISRFCE
jgi:hypothetical protein